MVHHGELDLLDEAEGPNQMLKVGTHQVITLR